MLIRLEGGNRREREGGRGGEEEEAFEGGIGRDKSGEFLVGTG